MTGANDTNTSEEAQRLITSVVKEMAGKIDASLFTATSTAPTAVAKPFTLKDIWKVKLSVLGFEIKESPTMPENCIALVAKDSDNIAWFDMETKKIYVMDTKKIMEDLSWPTIR